MTPLITSPQPVPPCSSSYLQVTPRFRKPKTSFTRQRRGCLTCRHRKKKCDELAPVCGSCSRLNFVCKREPPRDVATSPSSSAAPAHEHYASPVSVASTFDPQDVPEMLRLAQIHDPLDPVKLDGKDGKDLSTSRRAMMRYYTTTLAIMLSATGENNCFLSVLLPMAFDCPILIDAMAAWSSAHVALKHPEFEEVSLQHRGRVLSKLGASLRENSLSAEMCLAVSMSLCSMDTISDGVTSGWAHHLTGAAAGLIPRGKSAKSTVVEFGTASFEGKWLLRNLAYHDILMSVSMDRRPLLVGDYWMSDDDAQADPYFAFASRILQLTSEISVMSADCAEQQARDSPPEDDESSYFQTGSLLQKAGEIACSLREWSCPPSCAAAAAAAPLTLLSETYRGAAMIHLHRVLRTYFPSQEMHIIPEGIQEYVASICDTSQSIPDGSLAECSLLFPLFMDGGEAENETHIDIVRSRLSTMNKWRRFQHVEACRQVLDEVWRSNAGAEPWGLNGTRLDWRDVVRRRGWQLALS